MKPSEVAYLLHLASWLSEHGLKLRMEPGHGTKPTFIVADKKSEQIYSTNDIDNIRTWLAGYLTGKRSNDSA